ncbi:hypothetical protein C0J52_09222 [Blattella germanica]|nr:hypothetical protein C0J52_09222 [Blattella germanica]
MTYALIIKIYVSFSFICSIWETLFLVKTVNPGLYIGTPLPQLEDDHWLNDFAYLTDLSEQLNKLNSRLQGRNQNIVQMYDKIKSFVLSLDIWMSNLKERQFHNFVCLQTRPRVSDEQLYTYV